MMTTAVSFNRMGTAGAAHGSCAVWTASVCRGYTPMRTREDDFRRLTTARLMKLGGFDASFP